MTHNKCFLCTRIPFEATKPIIQNAGAFHLQPKCVSIITVQAPTELKPQHIYELSTSDDLSDGLIPLAVNHKVNHKNPKLLNIHVLNTLYNRVYVPRSTTFGTLKILDTENAEVNEISWTKLKKLDKKNIENRLQELCHCSHTNNELPPIPPQQNIQLEHDNQNKQLVLLEDAQVPQKAWNKH